MMTTCDVSSRLTRVAQLLILSATQWPRLLQAQDPWEECAPGCMPYMIGGSCDNQCDNEDCHYDDYACNASSRRHLQYNNGPPPPPVFTVASGAQYCQLNAQGCVTDGAGDYGNNEHCTIQVATATTVTATSYIVESSCDYLTVNGQRYPLSGSGPSNVLVPANGVITWQSDGFVNHAGFVLCGVHSPPPPPPVFTPPPPPVFGFPVTSHGGGNYGYGYGYGGDNHGYGYGGGEGERDGGYGGREEENPEPRPALPSCAADKDWCPVCPPEDTSAYWVYGIISLSATVGIISLCCFGCCFHPDLFICLEPGKRRFDPSGLRVKKTVTLAIDPPRNAAQLFRQQANASKESYTMFEFPGGFMCKLFCSPCAIFKDQWSDAGGCGLCFVCNLMLYPLCWVPACCHAFCCYPGFSRYSALGDTGEPTGDSFSAFQFFRLFDTDDDGCVSRDEWTAAKERIDQQFAEMNSEPPTSTDNDTGTALLQEAGQASEQGSEQATEESESDRAEKKAWHRHEMLLNFESVFELAMFVLHLLLFVIATVYAIVYLQPIPEPTLAECDSANACMNCSDVIQRYPQCELSSVSDATVQTEFSAEVPGAEQLGFRRQLDERYGDGEDPSTLVAAEPTETQVRQTTVPLHLANQPECAACAKQSKCEALAPSGTTTKAEVDFSGIETGGLTKTLRTTTHLYGGPLAKAQTDCQAIRNSNPSTMEPGQGPNRWPGNNMLCDALMACFDDTSGRQVEHTNCTTVTTTVLNDKNLTGSANISLVYLSDDFYGDNPPILARMAMVRFGLIATDCISRGKTMALITGVAFAISILFIGLVLFAAPLLPIVVMVGRAVVTVLIAMVLMRPYFACGSIWGGLGEMDAFSVIEHTEGVTTDISYSNRTVTVLEHHGPFVFRTYGAFADSYVSDQLRTLATSSGPLPFVVAPTFTDQDGAPLDMSTMPLPLSSSGYYYQVEQVLNNAQSPLNMSQYSLNRSVRIANLTATRYETYTTSSSKQDVHELLSGLSASVSSISITDDKWYMDIGAFLCFLLGLLVLVYTGVRGFHEAQDLPKAIAVFKMVQVRMRKHVAKVALIWIPTLLMNFGQVTAWGLAQGYTSSLVGCSALCTTAPTFESLFFPTFWIVSNIWTSRFITTAAYTKVCERFLDSDLDTEEEDFKPNVLRDWGNVVVAAAVMPLVEVTWTTLTLPFAAYEKLWGANVCCCCCSFCPIRRALLRFEVLVVRRVNTFALWRATKEKSDFIDGIKAQQVETIEVLDARHPALHVRHDLSILDASVDGIGFIVGTICAGVSLLQCESEMQAFEMFVTGQLIGSAIPIPINAALDHLFGCMDDDADSFKDDTLFQKLVQFEDFAAIAGPVVPLQPVSTTFESEAEFDNPLRDGAKATVGGD